MYKILFENENGEFVYDEKEYKTEKGALKNSIYNSEVKAQIINQEDGSVVAFNYEVEQTTEEVVEEIVETVVDVIETEDEVIEVVKTDVIEVEETVVPYDNYEGAEILVLAEDKIGNKVTYQLKEKGQRPQTFTISSDAFDKLIDKKIK